MIPENRADVLVSRTASAIRGYQAMVGRAPGIGDLATMGTYLGNWRQDMNVVQVVGKFPYERDKMVRKAHVAYALDESGARLVFRAGSRRVPGNPERLLYEWLGDDSGVPPYAAVALQRRDGEQNRLSDVAVVRFRLHSPGVLGFLTQTHVREGSDSRIIPGEVEGVIIEQANSEDVATMFAEIFSLAGEY